AEFLTYRGYDLAKDLNYDLAIEFYARSIQSNPIYAKAYERRAEAQLALRRLDLALTDIARSLELDDSVAETWLTKGRILQKKGDTAGAKEAVQKAIGLDPKNEAAKQMLEEISKEN
ncbi:MAG TPA: hypothetical protein VHQ01_07670, partial [Pyrinomonadaceae bacterium]|nr:hypothetical protein [Pyrinomonadaceae bacterium]